MVSVSIQIIGKKACLEKRTRGLQLMIAESKIYLEPAATLWKNKEDNSEAFSVRLLGISGKFCWGTFILAED